ncbi:hypothetical protein Mgra_00009433 [Meloidogyne graminicola]|uniref:Uncharacterized protein n=1 Tax=Meloidogyne graminicola TaxID=189291 RepID=A0A8S9Z9A2_9BILA|nr:hypothetical protein Mgra_00009433 [Meloidogyne graminicola]
MIRPHACYYNGPSNLRRCPPLKPYCFIAFFNHSEDDYTRACTANPNLCRIDLNREVFGDRNPTKCCVCHTDACNFRKVEANIDNCDSYI